MDLFFSRDLMMAVELKHVALKVYVHFNNTEMCWTEYCLQFIS